MIGVIAIIAGIALVGLRGAIESARIANTLRFEASMHRLLGADLIGWWMLNETGPPFSDASGFGNDGTCNVALGQCPTSAEGVPGKKKGALRFDGDENFVNVPNFRVGDTHTISFWLNLFPQAPGHWRQILAVRGVAVSERGPGIWTSLHFPQRMLWQYMPGYLGPSNIGPGGEGTDFSLNTWYHIVGAKEGPTFRFFVNGRFVASVAVPSPMLEGTHMRIGRTISFPRNMIIDDVRIYSRALTAQEVQTLYAQTKNRFLTKSK